MKSTVYFDGSCPLCRAEIEYYRPEDQADALCFVHISAGRAVTPEGITRQQATERFHVRAGDGRVLSGALAAVELGYLMFLPVRPFISRLFGRVAQLKVVGDGASRG
jgi:predicted DCC family thiol-disulfide oxidoreductase YuxK